MKCRKVCHSRAGGNPERDRLDSRLRGNDEVNGAVYATTANRLDSRLRGNDERRAIPAKEQCHQAAVTIALLSGRNAWAFEEYENSVGRTRDAVITI